MEYTCSTVLIPCDTSDHLEYGVRFYFNRLHKPGNRVILLHVDNDITHEHEDPDEINTAKEEKTRITSLMKDRLTRISIRAGVTNTEFMVEVTRDVWQIILKVADKIKADMIVMASKGRGVIRRTLIGSVCDSVVHHAHIPVTVIKDPTKHVWKH